MLKIPATKCRAFIPVGLADRRWPDVVLTVPPVWCSVDLCGSNQALISIQIQGTGTGLIDAFVDGLSRANVEPLRVLDYHEFARGSGADAHAVAYLEPRVRQQTVFGVDIDANIVSASLKAIDSAVQKARPISTNQESIWQKN